MGAGGWMEGSPFGLRRFGVEFITVARDALKAYRDREPELHDRQVLQFRREQLLELAPFPIYFNFLHGVELGLKSYLLQVGPEPLGEIRKRFSHRLDCLLDEARKYDLHRQCPELKQTHIDVIRHSSQLYASKQFEYIRTGGVSLVPIDQVAEAAETLITGLKRLPMEPARPPGPERKK